MQAHLSRNWRILQCVGASLLAITPRPPRGTCQPASSLTIIVGSPPGASSLLQSVKTGSFPMSDLDRYLQAVTRDNTCRSHRTLRSHVGRFSAGNRRQRGALPGSRQQRRQFAGHLLQARLLRGATHQRHPLIVQRLIAFRQRIRRLTTLALPVDDEGAYVYFNQRQCLAARVRDR